MTLIVSILFFSNSNKVLALGIKYDNFLVVSLVLQPVEELNENGTSERPLEAVIMLTFHDDSKD